MNIFERLSRLIFPHLDEDERTEILRNLSDYEADLSCLENQYITFADRKAFTEKWNPVVTKIKSKRIPKRDEAYAPVCNFLGAYSDINTTFSKSNEAFIKAESDHYNSLLSNIDGKSLDEQQRAVVICNEDRNLVLAGAGSGKTLTISGKVKYLCSEKGINPEDILLISFTKKAAEEMTVRISERLGIPVQATTFHKLGLDIISDAQGKRPDVADNLSVFVRSYFEDHIIKDKEAIKNLIEYFAYYLNVPADMEQFDSLGAAYDYEKGIDFETIKSKYDREKFIGDANAERRVNRRTLQNEQVKSLDEVSIANFLFLNGVRYEYERAYPFESADPEHRSYKPDFYLPDYDIYIEHFGIDRQGNLPWLSPIEEEKYKEGMIWKRAFHKEHGTKLLETYSYYSSDGCLLTKLEALLHDNGVKFKEPDFLDIFNTVYAKESDKYFSEFIKLCCTFITLFKSNGYTETELTKLQNRNPKYNKNFFIRRTELFKAIVAPVLAAYDHNLEENNAIDFSDMINKAAMIVNGGFKAHAYKWVIVDEYQDISVARFKLVKAILDQTGAKLLCVGDDWQSIYRFAGSDITLFTDFEHYFGQSEIMRIEKTYRNSQELIDETGKFVMQNPAQFKKQLRSDKTIDTPIVFSYYRDNPFNALKQAVDRIIHDFGETASILMLGRTNYDAEMIAQSQFFQIMRDGTVNYKASPNTPITFMSAHKSKGLEADNVILLNFQNSTLGFPNKISDDPILELVLTSGDDYLYAEERRLLYVALTRTKNRAYVLVNSNRPSEFMSEFKPSRAVAIQSDTEQALVAEIACPRCKTGHLTVRKNESTNRYFVGCSHYPQCDYTVNDTSVMNEPKRCPRCGGFMVRRKGRYGTFYGCTNYPRCNYTEQIETT